MSSTSDNSWEKILVGSPSYYIYEQFDNDVNEAKYDNYCSPFKNSGNGADLEYFKLCKKMSRNTDILSKFHDKNEFTTLCSHYRYWTYYNLKRVLGEITDNNKAKPIIQKFMQSQNNINEIYNAYYCKYDFKNDIFQRLNIMNEEKYLYDYFQNYDSIKTSDTCNVVTSDKYEIYLKYIITLYNKRKGEDECCYGSFLIGCEDYFKCDDEFDPKKLLSTLNSNISKKCGNLTNSQTTLTSGVTSHSGSSKADFRSSIYLVRCTDIPKDRPSDNELTGSKIKCQVLPLSAASLNNPSSSFTHRPPDHNSENGADLEYFKLCKKMSRNTDILSKYHNKNEFTTLCSHYRYWTYYNIKRVLGEKTGNDKAKPIIQKFMQSQNNINEIYNAYYCKYDFKNDIFQRLNIMNEEKYLYDYFQNYDSIKTSDTCNVVTSDKYEIYLKYIITLYNKRKGEDECCYGSFLIGCEDYFKCDDEFDPKKLLSTLNSNISKKCGNLTNSQTTLTSGVTSHSGSSKADFRSSIYLVRCTDIPKDRPSDNELTGSKIKCQVLPLSAASLNNPSSSFTHRPPDHVPFTIDGHTETPVSIELKRDNEVSSGSSGSQSHLSNSDTLDVIKDNSAEKCTLCEDPQLATDKSGTCIEPDVRTTKIIEVKLETYAPGKTVRIRIKSNTDSSHISYNNTNMFKNKFFRGGIAFTLIIGIIFTIFLFYKFTLFGRCFHKKVTRKKRIDDYYDDPYMRQFIIRAPKYGNRRTANRGLQFSYYSR
ncbi:PIR Superfamily Protein [Plasmodium malariae]|uniref:PIR Superfamily Protein n=1 Tax=Plasmodium malariae TaxID=5858 RepID=A0A1A8WUZ9_PLAMA|nr:PIR Superfamily Protein [Plasmodium malariae]